MNEKQNWQKEFINEMIEGMKKNLNRMVDDGKIPEDWDGYELRLLLLNEAEKYNSGSHINKREKRYKDFKNHILVNYL